MIQDELFHCYMEKFWAEIGKISKKEIAIPVDDPQMVWVVAIQGAILEMIEKYFPNLMDTATLAIQNTRSFTAFVQICIELEEAQDEMAVLAAIENHREEP